MRYRQQPESRTAAREHRPRAAHRHPVRLGRHESLSLTKRLRLPPERGPRIRLRTPQRSGKPHHLKGQYPVLLNEQARFSSLLGPQKCRDDQPKKQHHHWINGHPSPVSPDLLFGHPARSPLRRRPPVHEPHHQSRSRPHLRKRYQSGPLSPLQSRLLQSRGAQAFLRRGSPESRDRRLPEKSSGMGSLNPTED